ncbi:MAG TPA: class I SAM-dependent methyltransferase [Thermohalobaculum sp.]|nr:class I SAM-dependent methyltransferase [Thermohalobaculum sp.]
MAEAEFWAGEMGKEWARRADALDRQLAAAGAAGLTALAARPGECILDLGCGSGATTIELCQAVGPDGAVTGVDISSDQVAAAQTRPGNERAEFVVGNAETWPFEAATYDALFSRFGCMFFGDPPAAYVNIRRALKPDARVVLVVWRALKLNPWADVPARVGAEVLGPTEPPVLGAPGPFAWADPVIFQPILEGAGFTGLEWAEQPITMQIGEAGQEGPIARAVAMLMRVGPLARRLKGLPTEERTTIAARLAPKLEPFVEDGWVRLPGTIWVVRARA